MPNTPASRPDVAEIEARANLATPGDWISKGMGGDSYVLAPTHKWHRPSLCKRGYPIAIPRPYQDMDGHQTVDFSSAGFAHDDAKFIAHARQDIPALIAYIGRLEAVVEAARELREPLYNFFGFDFDIYLHDNKTWSGDCTPKQARAEHEKCDAAQSKLKKALAVLGDGDG